MSDGMLDKGYEPSNVEKKWYAQWIADKQFAATDADPGRQAYSIVIPPPNVTGVLHMGHALNNTVQDILCRYRRAKGDNVLWMPGTDHAGIATQNVVERQLAAEGLDRHQVGREAFIERVWKWREESGSAIINQLKRLGASCDWDRERFTMDEGLSKAVRTVFVRLYDDGLIYRGHYIINWCPRCQTALADLEVEHEPTPGKLYHIRYPYADGSGHIVVVTTRPETMLGDTGVAIHPEDERYQHLKPTSVMLPLMNREIPIIRDDYVDMTFGTGGLKVTPAHDPNDFEIAKRHDLPAIKVIADDGTMTAEAGRFEGLDRVECRTQVVAALEAEGLLEQIEDHDHSVGHCYRCKSIVEPNLSKQWFVSVKPLAEKAIDAVRTGKTRIIPENWTKTYYDWMENIRDWCISRQIWWGHQIPAWTCGDCGRLVVAMAAPADCPDCNSNRMVQESDVLDTWFSSALWPFSTMGWPDKTDLLKTFYPTSALVTGFDILFFWVARMMMMGIHFMDDIPFKDVYVHALVRDEQGAKMSKSKGNVIDPLVVIDKYGTDAFRFTLTAFAVQGRDVKMSERRVEGYRHFVNKLWNAARFSLMHVESPGATIDRNALDLPSRWILSRLSRTASTVATSLDAYKFNEAASALYKFVWHELCDWYLEAAKPALYDKGSERCDANLSVLWRVLHDTLILLHPIMPFVTEEIWHHLPGAEGSIMTAAYPETDADGVISDPTAEADMDQVMATITAIRNIRGEMNLPPAKALTVQVQSGDADQRATLETNAPLIANLAKAADFSVTDEGEKPRTSAATVISGATVLVDLQGIIDFEVEAARLQKEIGKLDKEIGGMSKKLTNQGFLSKAPANVVAGVQEKHDAAAEKRSQLAANLERIDQMRG